LDLAIVGFLCFFPRITRGLLNELLFNQPYFQPSDLLMYQKLLHSIFGSFIVLLKSFVAYTQYDSLYGFGDVISVPVSAEGSYKTSQSPLMIKETRNCATSL